jgi:hypothetical protein
VVVAAAQTPQARHRLILEFLAVPAVALPLLLLAELVVLERLDREILAGPMVVCHPLMEAVAVAEQVPLVLSETPRQAVAQAALEFLIQSQARR